MVLTLSVTILSFTSCVLTVIISYGVVSSANCSHVFDYLIVIGCTLKGSYKFSIVLHWTVTISTLQLISLCEMTLFHITLIGINAWFNMKDTPNFEVSGSVYLIICKRHRQLCNGLDIVLSFGSKVTRVT